AAALAAGAVALTAPAAASAAHVTSLQPWAATNAYLAKADIDGRQQPKSEPRAKTDHVKAGDWVRISCQTTGETFNGSNVWDKVGDYYVPDQLLKTYSDSVLAGVPRCDPGGPEPTQTPQLSAGYLAAQSAGFGATPDGAARVMRATAARSGTAGVLMVRFFIPNALAGGRLLKGDGRGWSSDPSQSLASRASLYWDTRTGRTSLTIDPTHVADYLPKSFWGVEPHDLPGPLPVVLWPHKYSLPDRIRGGASNTALPIQLKGRASSVRSTDLHARGTNQAWIAGSGRTLQFKVSMLNSVTNIVDIGAWSVDTSFKVAQKPDGSFKVSSSGNGYPAVESYFYPATGSPSTVFLRRVHEWAFDREIGVPTLPKFNTGMVDPGGGIAALDKASNLRCKSTAGGGSRCTRDGMGLNPLPELIAPDSYTTTSADRAG
ncbi:hypothetical protein AB0L40_20400, partial [Patulibacter sp. NPDC049589]